MRLSYGNQPINDSTKALARELVAVIVKANVTYKNANDALEEAQRIIEAETKPLFSD